MNTVNIQAAEGAGGIALPTTGVEADFTRGLTVFDSVGSAQTLTLEFRKITGPMANITSRNGVSLEGSDTITDSLTDISENDSFEIELDGDTLILEFFDDTGQTPTIIAGAGETVVAVSTVQEMLDAVNAATFGATAGMEARLNSSGQILLQSASPDEDFNLRDGAAGTAVSGGAGTFDFGDDTDILVEFTDYATDYADQTAVFPGLTTQLHQTHKVGGK